MSNVRILLTGLVVVFATLAAGSKDAHAQRRMLVLIDASGSMTTPRPGDTLKPTRFHAAKALALQRVNEQDALGLDGVAVFTFQDSSATARTPGFVPTNDALIAINGLDPTTVPFGATPLAGSMCDAVDALVADGGATKILQVSSDGEENATLATHPCFGPFSTTNVEPFSDGSWQNKVYVKAVGNVIVRIDLFNPAPIISLTASAPAVDPEGGGTAMRQQLAKSTASLTGDQPATLEEFFGALARATGGQLVVAHDEEPLPIFADMNDDRCVDRTDAILLARQFGKSIPVVDGKFDLNQDGVVGFADYQILLDNRTPGCGQPDPYVLREPIACHGAQVVTIDHAVIESTALAIDARGACKVTITNSLLVAGQDAIKILGAAIVTVDNSIIVGEHGSLAAVGATKLSAANTIFHGKKQTVGAFLYVDRGGNVWE